jgi:hypothetical protein
VLIGQLLLQDWTVVKIILTAIAVGMIGVFTLHHFGKVNLHIKPPAVTAIRYPVTTESASARRPQSMQLAHTANH